MPPLMIMPVPVRARAAVPRLSPMKVPSSILPNRSTHQHVAGLELVDDPRILATGAPLVGADRLRHVVQAGRIGTYVRCHDPSGQRHVWLQVQWPVTLELVVVVVAAFEHAPRLVVGDQLQPLEQVIRPCRGRPSSRRPNGLAGVSAAMRSGLLKIMFRSSY